MTLPPPNHTQTPNDFYDELLAQIDTLSELKITLAIIRQTFGWHKDEDKISLSQFEVLTGLSRESVSDGIDRALRRGTIQRHESGNSFLYSLAVSGGVVKNSDQPKQSSDPTIASQAIRPTKERERKERKRPWRKSAACIQSQQGPRTKPPV